MTHELKIPRSANSLLSVAQLVDEHGSVSGAAFALSGGVALTCAHVVEAAGGAPGSAVRLRFPGQEETTGVVLADGWSPPQEHDVAVIELECHPGEGLALGAASGSRGHSVWSFGFPKQADLDGHHGYADAGDLLRDGTLLQLTAANDLTRGYSGGPVVDEVTGLVIGMVTKVTKPDPLQRGQNIAYATTAECLRAVWPDLAVADICPYRGLEPFTSDHADWFNGRGVALDKVIAAIKAHPSALLVLGPSGAGKSSLVQAGIVPALARGVLPVSDRWRVVLTQPGEDLVSAVARARDEAPSQRVVLVVDQVEQMLSGSGRDELDRLTPLIGTSLLTVVLVMRDDFYSVLAAEAADLLEAIGSGVVNIPATLSTRDLHDIITDPAEAVGGRLQEGLAERIIADVRAINPGSEVPATVLPLLEVALSQLWQRRDNGVLTHDEYRRIGGISGSLSAWCDEAVDALPRHDTHREMARRMLTALVRPADVTHGIPAVRQQVRLTELKELAASGPDADAGPVLQTLVQHRVVITRTPDAAADPVAELVHDALIRDWHALKEWIAQERHFNDWLRRVNEQHEQWTVRQRRNDLLHGSQLEDGLRWSAKRRLPRSTATFVAASRKKNRLDRLLLNGAFCMMALLTVIAVVAALVAQESAAERNDARAVGLSRLLAGQSKAVAETQPVTARQLAAAAWRTSPTDEARDALVNAQIDQQHAMAAHVNAVTGLAFSPDGTRLASSSEDGTVRLWWTATGRPVGEPLRGHKGSVNAVAFSPDGTRLASAGDDGTIRLWDPVRGVPVGAPMLGHTGPVMSVAFHPGGDLLASAGTDDRTVRLWNLRTGTQKGDPLRGHSDVVRSVRFSPDGTRLASGGDDGSIRQWDPATGRAIAEPIEAGAWAVRDVAFGAGGKLLASAHADGSLLLWNPATGKQVSRLTDDSGKPLLSVAFSPDGGSLASAGTDKSVRLWSGQRAVPGGVPLTGHTDTVFSVQFSPDGSMLASAGGEGMLRLWDVKKSQSSPAPLLGSSKQAIPLAFTPDGTRLAVGVGANSLRVVDATSGLPLGPPMNSHTDAVTSAAFSRDGKRLASGSADHSIRIWDPDTGQPVDPPLTGHTKFVSDVEFSPDGAILASAGDDGSVRLWDVAIGRELTPPLLGQRTSRWIRSLAFSPDGTRLAALGSDGNMWLWNPATREQIGPVRVVTSTSIEATLAFTSDSKQVVTADASGVVGRWKSVDGSKVIDPVQISTEARDPAQISSAYRLTLTRDGSRLALTMRDPSKESIVKIWDTDSGKWISPPLTGHDSSVNGLMFKPDGTSLAIRGEDGTVRLWNTALPGVVHDRLCADYGALSPAGWSFYAPAETPLEGC